MAAARIEHYYLTATGLDGGTTAPSLGLVGAFNVVDFRFDIGALTRWIEGHQTPTVGGPMPEPLVIDLEPGSPSGFLKAITQKQTIPHLRLQGLTAESEGGHTVYDLRLDNVVVKKVTETDGIDRLELLYGAVSVTTREQISDRGPLGPAETIGWNVIAGTAFTTPLTAAVGRPADGTMEGRTFDYFLTVEGLGGGVRAPGHEGAFAVEHFSFDIGSLSQWASGAVSVGGAAAGPLVVDLFNGRDLTGFVHNIAQGRSFSRVRLEGGLVGGTNPTVYDLRLQNAYLAKLADTDRGDRLELVYEAASLTTTELNRDGAVVSSATISWNAAGGPSTGLLPAARPSGDVGGALLTPHPSLYLTVSGLDGEVSAPGYVGTFAVAHYSFDIDALVHGTSGPRRPHPAPLKITLARDSRLGGGFLPDITVGTGIPRLVRLEGVRTLTSGGSLTVYDLRLEDALVSRLTHTRGADHLQLVYKAMSLTTRDVSPSQTPGQTRTIGWNVVAGTTSSVALTAAVPGMTLIGDASNNTLSGGRANDVLDGQGGPDSMFGGGGDDRYFVDNARDQVHEAAGAGNDTVWTKVDYALAANQEIENLHARAGLAGLTLTGNGLNNEIVGAARNDTLIGGAGNDRLVGHDGDDLLVGGAGADSLHGGTGNDIFAWHLAAEGGDTVADFTPGVDRLQFDAAAFGIVGNNFDFVAGSNPQAAGDGPTFLMNTANHSLYFDPDGRNSTAPVLIAHLHGGDAAASDLRFV